ncbi:hypothetical protein [Clostridium paraputrificum]
MFIHAKCPKIVNNWTSRHDGDYICDNEDESRRNSKTIKEQIKK